MRPPEDFPAGAATGIGSYPGTDPVETARMVFGELPDLPHLPELPGRGPGADLTGRSAALLVDLAVDLQPSGWRFVPRAGVDQRRARDFLARDLDALEEVAEGYAGPLKIQAAGPWTLAATIELHRGDKALSDPGAVRDLGQSLAAGLQEHVREVRRRVPGAEVLLQLDEPSLPATLAGTIRTASGFETLAAVEESTVESALAGLVESLDAPVVVHCCAAGPPIDLVRRAGACAIAVDAALARDEDAVGAAIEAGLRLFLGVVPGTDTEPSTVDPADPARRLWHRLGLAPERLAGAVVLTPACGLAGASPAYARRALTACREAARALADAPEPTS